MARTSDRQPKSGERLIEVMEYLLQQNEPASATDVARGVGEAVGTVRCYLALLVDRKWARMSGLLYEPGPRIPGMWAAYRIGLENKIETLQRELQSTEV